MSFAATRRHSRPQTAGSYISEAKRPRSPETNPGGSPASGEGRMAAARFAGYRPNSAVSPSHVPLRRSVPECLYEASRSVPTKHNSPERRRRPNELRRRQLELMKQRVRPATAGPASRPRSSEGARPRGQASSGLEVNGTSAAGSAAVIAATEAADQLDGACSSHRGAGAVQGCPKCHVSGPVPWARVGEFSNYSWQQEQRLAAGRARARQKEVAECLDRQVAEREERLRKEKDEVHVYRRNMAVDSDNYHAGNVAAREEQRRKAKEELEVRSAQIEEVRRLADARRKQEEATDAALLQRLAHEQEDEARKAARRKAQREAEQRKTMVENDRNRELRERAKADSLQRDHEAVREAQRLAQEEASKRAAEIAARVEKQRKFVDMMEANVVAQQNNAAAEDEERARRQQEEREARALEADSLKKEQLRRKQQETGEMLEKQMRERQEKKAEERRQKEVLAGVLAADTEQYLASEREKAEARKKRNYEFAAEQRRLLEEKNARKRAAMNGSGIMSDIETSINKDLVCLMHRALEERDGERAADAVRRAAARGAEDEDC